MKFNWDEFLDENNKIAAHCKTEEEAIDFCKQMDEHGTKEALIWKILVFQQKAAQCAIATEACLVMRRIINEKILKYTNGVII